jgi:hypothetical protein
MPVQIDTSIVIEDLVEPTEDEDSAAARVPTEVAEAFETWAPPA